MFAEYQKKLSMAMLIVNAWSAYSMNVFEAIEKGDVEEVARIVDENPAAINYIEEHDKNTPLHAAAKHGHVEIILFLLSQGADVNVTNENVHHPLWEVCKEPPLSRAATSGSYDAVVLLVQHGADVNQGSAYCSPLKRAVRAGNSDVVRFLMQHGALCDVSLERKMRSCWPFNQFGVDQYSFKHDRIAFLMNQFGLPKDIAILILMIEGIVPLKAREGVGVA